MATTLTPTVSPAEPMARALDRALREKFPPVQFSMAYGSGVFQQKNHDASTSLLDLVFAVDDPVAWHDANLTRNGDHYSCLQYFGAKGVAGFQVSSRWGLLRSRSMHTSCRCIDYMSMCCRVQENYGAGVYYNTLVSA